MQALYDAHIFSSQRLGGVSRHYYELFKGMQQLGCKVKVAGLFVKNHYLLSDNQYKKSFIYDPLQTLAFVNRILLKQALSRIDKNTVFHPSYPSSYIARDILSVKKVVFTIHDMIVEKEGCISADKRHFAQNSSRIIAVSEATKRDIVELWGIDPDKIAVVYHAPSLRREIARQPSTSLPNNYLLYVGNRDGYKNFTPFVRAIAPLLKNDSDLYLVYAGRSNFSKKEGLLFQQLGIEQKIISVRKPSDNELAYLYCRAKAFAFPSLNEGFGIPILEAWACGTPLILSDNPCFKEIAAEAGHYFTPDSEDSIRNTVEEVLSNTSLQTDLIRKGKSRLRLFSWEKAIGQTHKVYQSLL
jgi:glycosyltransferase involved in cell wall biosynthesis